MEYPVRSVTHRVRYSLLLAAALLLATVLPAAAQTVRVLPLGDSQTHGWEGHASYRYPLWFMLDDAGHSVDFVGTLQDTQSGVPNLDWYPLYLTAFDRDHEGHSGWRTDQLAAIADSVILATQPDIVLLMAGGNDVGQMGAAGINNANSYLRLIIDVVRVRNPEAVILLAQISPFGPGNGYFPQARYVEGLNDAIAQIAAERSTTMSPIVLVDHHTGFDLDTMLQADGLHVNRAGEEWLAGNWFSALQTVLPAPGNGPGFRINSGLNDAWYNPSTPGQGFFFNVFPQLGLVFISWFTYETTRPGDTATAMLGEPGHRWLTGIGPFEGDTANVVLELTEGGVFNNADPAVQQTQGYGTLDLEFHDCANATVRFSIPAAGLSGSLPVQRIVSDNVALCELLQDEP